MSLYFFVIWYQVLHNQMKKKIFKFLVNDLLVHLLQMIQAVDLWEILQSCGDSHYHPGWHLQKQRGCPHEARGKWLNGCCKTTMRNINKCTFTAEGLQIWSSSSCSKWIEDALKWANEALQGKPTIHLTYFTVKLVKRWWISNCRLYVSARFSIL